MDKVKTKIVKDTSERWLLTYSDLMNLLLILFIILYTWSKVDTGKYQQLSSSLRSAMGVSSSASYFSTGGGGTTPMSLGLSETSEAEDTEDSEDSEGTEGIEGGLTPEQQQMSNVMAQVNELIKEQNLQGSVEVSMQERGVLISIKAQLLFESGSADIEQSSISTLRDIGRILMAMPGKPVRIEGHTDTDPINTYRYPDNQELSTARANNVLRLLEKEVGIAPTILSATGYGEYRPKVPNTTAENKAQNRRVDIVILNSSYEKSEPDKTVTTK